MVHFSSICPFFPSRKFGRRCVNDITYVRFSKDDNSLLRHIVMDKKKKEISGAVVKSLGLPTP